MKQFRMNSQIVVAEQEMKPRKAGYYVFAVIGFLLDEGWRCEAGVVQEEPILLAPIPVFRSVSCVWSLGGFCSRLVCCSKFGRGGRCWSLRRFLCSYILGFVGLNGHVV